MSDEPNSDELSAFVSSTLKAIAAGIQGAQDSKISSAHGTGYSGYAAPKEVEFDIAVSAKKSENVGGGFKVAVFGIGANAGGSGGSENSTISRIRFLVPTNFKENPKPAPHIPSTHSPWTK